MIHCLIYIYHTVYHEYSESVVSYSFNSNYDSEEESVHDRRYIFIKYNPFINLNFIFQCDTCTRHRETMAKRPAGMVLMFEMRAWRAHVSSVMAEREVYYQHRSLAIDKWEEYLSFIIDGADQSAYAVPHAATTTKSESTAYKQKMKMIGMST
jgi:hypothetical protein